MRNYATQMDAAKRGIVTPEIETVAKRRTVRSSSSWNESQRVRLRFRRTSIHKSLSAEAVGDGTRVKINVNLGISGDCKGLRDGAAQGAHGR